MPARVNKYDIILLPGLKLNSDGSPRDELRLRAQKAASLYKQGVGNYIVACGGDAAGTGVTEAEAMKRLLTQLRVPESSIICEDRSLITAENFRNAARLVGSGRRAALTTSDYHMARAKLLCRRSGFKVKGFKVKTPGGKAKLGLYIMELLGILDALCGWQDEGRARPERVERFKLYISKRLTGN